MRYGGSLTARTCADSELSRILRATLRAFSSAQSPRLTGPRFGGILPHKPQRKPTCELFLCHAALGSKYSDMQRRESYCCSAALARD